MSANSFLPPTINSETVFHLGSFEFRNTLIMAWITVILLIVVALKLRRTKYQDVPGKFQNFIEVIIEGVYNFFHSVVQNHKQALLLFPLCATIFFYILISNWLGLLPGVGAFGVYEQHEGQQILVPLLRSTYSDLNMTLAIALISVVLTQYFGIKYLGTFHYLGKFFVNPFKNPIGTFVGFLELISEFSRIISLSFRLFGNVFAGDVLLAVMTFLLPFIAPIPFYGLELFVGLIQALVFCLLTLIFVKMAMTPHGEYETSSKS